MCAILISALVEIDIKIRIFCDCLQIIRNGLDKKRAYYYSLITKRAYYRIQRVLADKTYLKGGVP